MLAGSKERSRVERQELERSEGPPLQRTIKGLILAAGVMYA